MKIMMIVLLSVLVLCSFVGCQRSLGGTVLEYFGMEFSSQIEMIETCLSVNLDDLTDSNIKTMYSFTDANGNDLTIRYIDLDGAGAFVEKDIASSEHWRSLPYDSVIKDLLGSSGATKQFGFESIRDGYFVMSGVGLNKDAFDFDHDHFHEWYAFEIGIWDSNDETLYYISITNQTEP